MIHVIYFNQWFSSMTEVMRDMKEKHRNSIRIIASSKNPLHVYKDVVDEFIVEDWEETPNENINRCNYISWLQQTLDVYNVDVAFIRKHADWVAIEKDVVSMGRRKIILEDFNILSNLECKSGVYGMLIDSAKLSRLVPTYYNLGSEYDKVVSIVNDAYKDDASKCKICFKLNYDEGGQSFRGIKNQDLNNINTLHKSTVNTLSVSEALAFFTNLSESDRRKIIVMEYLHGPEISVDCYRSKQGFIAICREKESTSRVQRVHYDAGLSAVCRVISDELNIEYPFNAQFRFAERENGKKELKLMDLNLRMSGGVYHETAVGLNLAEVCMLDAIDKENLYDIKDFIEFEEKRVTHFESAVEIF